MSEFKPRSFENLEIKYSKLEGIQIEGLSEIPLESYGQCLDVLMQGSSNRMQFETAMNKKSSRSHTIFQLIFEVLDGDRHRK